MLNEEMLRRRRDGVQVSTGAVQVSTGTASEGVAPMRALEDAPAAPAPARMQPPPPPPTAPPANKAPPPPPGLLASKGAGGAGVQASTGASVQASTGASVQASTASSTGAGVQASTGAGVQTLMEVNRRLSALQRELQKMTGEVNALQQIVVDAIEGKQW